MKFVAKGWYSWSIQEGQIIDSCVWICERYKLPFPTFISSFGCIFLCYRTFSRSWNWEKGGFKRGQHSSSWSQGILRLVYNWCGRYLICMTLMTYSFFFLWLFHLVFLRVSHTSSPLLKGNFLLQFGTSKFPIKVRILLSRHSVDLGFILEM